MRTNLEVIKVNNIVFPGLKFADRHKASAKDVFLDQERESKALRRSDIVIVLTVNDADRVVEYWVRNEGGRQRPSHNADLTPLEEN